MTTQRWQVVKDTVAEVSELSPEQRCAYLNRVCAHDVELRTEVESLLAAADSPCGLGDKPAIEILAPDLADRAERGFVGTRFGAYRIEREIGAGGMGSVFLGRRADQEYQQEVAIKVIRGSLFDGAVYRRFLQERQTLANLNHPNIARLLDGGRTAEGIPYLVMEYVAGESIDLYCNSRQLGLPARLRLFQKVCAAVHFAHQNLVVHRDLKPSNILVTPDGVPKLLDFGISKVLFTGDTQPAAKETQANQRCLTPEYASPEQIRGESVSTATDVYSLGVLLYELLTGRTPFQYKSGSLLELQNTVCQVDPERPSLAVRRTTRQFTIAGGDKRATPMTDAPHDQGFELPWRSLVGDLDAIVLKAMRKEPGERYASVEQLSSDIGRHLGGLPVLARAGTWRYRSSKFLKRNWVSIAATALVLTSLVGTTVFSMRSAEQARRDRDDAQLARRTAQVEAESARVEARKSERVRVFLQSMLRAANPNQQGPGVTVGALLDDAAANVSHDVGDDPEIESAVRHAIGDAYVGMGRYADAEPQLRKSLELQRSIHGGDHADVASSLNVLGTLYHAKGEFVAAQDYLEQSLAMRRRLSSDESPEVAQNLNNLAVVLGLQGRDAAAETMHRQALAIRRRLFGSQHADTAESLNNLGALLNRRRDYAAAEPLSREVLAIRQATFGKEHPLVTQAIHNLGVIIGRQGRLDEALPLVRESIDLYRAQLGPDHPDLSGALFNLGDLLLNSKDPEAAEPLLRESLSIRIRAFPTADVRAAQIHSALGHCLALQKKFADAEPLLIQAHQLQQEQLGAQHPATQETARRLAELTQARNRPANAASMPFVDPEPNANEPLRR